MAVRVRYHGAVSSRYLLAGCFVCFAFAGIVGLIAIFLPHWNTFPQVCNGFVEFTGKLERDTIVWISFSAILPQLALVCAILPRMKHHPQLWWRISVVLALIGLVGLILFNEMGLRYTSINAQFINQASEWGIGQVMAMILMAGQFLEIFKYIREKPNSTHSRYEVWVMSLRVKYSQKAKVPEREEGFSLIEVQPLS